MSKTFTDSMSDKQMIKNFSEAVEVINERSIVKMDKVAAKKKLFARATLISAKNANDPLYTKYVKASKIRKACREAIQIKYASKGKQLMKDYLIAQKSK